MSASDTIAVIALAVSVGSAVAAGISLYLGFRESDRRDEEIRLLRDEAGRREEELALLHQQVAAEHDARLHAQQAQIVVGEGGVPANSSDKGIEYRVPVQNIGAYAATRIAVELRSSTGAPAGHGVLDRTLVPGDKDTVTVTIPPDSPSSGPYTIHVEWDDGRRERNLEASSITVGEP